MRPRQRNLGCVGMGLVRVGFDNASMRPRQRNLGCRVDGADIQQVRDAASMRPRQRNLGCRAVDQDAAHDHPASMRPRQRNLGCTPTISPRPTRSWGFNEAEAAKPRMQKPRRGTRGLCTGCFNEAEAAKPRMRPADVVTGHRLVASMRPRQRNLGCSHPTTHWQLTQIGFLFERGSSSAGWAPSKSGKIGFTMSKSNVEST